MMVLARRVIGSPLGLAFTMGLLAISSCRVESGSDGDAGAAGEAGASSKGGRGGTGGSGGEPAEGGAPGSAGETDQGGMAGAAGAAAEGGSGGDTGPGGTSSDAGAGGSGEGPDEGGFIEAFLLHNGTERLLAGPDVNPDYGWVVPEGFTVSDLVFDLRNRSFALSGFGSAVWVRILAPFPEDGVPSAHLFSLDPATGSATESPLPDGDLSQGLHLRTTEDGSVCFANDITQGRMLRAPIGDPAEESFDYAGLLDFETNFGVSDDGLQMFIGNLGRFAGDPAIYVVNLISLPIDPVEHIPQSELALDGVEPRGLAPGQFDVAGDQPRYVFRTNHSSSQLDPATQDVFYLGDGFTSSTLTEIVHEPIDSSPRDLQITDLGTIIGYCEEGEGVNGVNRCLVRDLAEDLTYEVGDGRSRVGAFVLSDNGSKAYFRTDICCEQANGVFQLVGGETRRPAGTRTFFNTNAWANAQLDDTGTTLLAGVGDYLYLLRDGVAAPPEFPDIEHVFYRFNDDCSLSLWASTRDLPAEAQLLLDVYIDGVPPTVAVDGAINPFFSVRIPPDLVSEDGAASPRELTFPLTNDVGECVAEEVTTDYWLRLIAYDPDKGVTTFKDFTLD